MKDRKQLSFPFYSNPNRIWWSSSIHILCRSWFP